MIEESKSYIRREGFGPTLFVSSTGKAWTQTQFWNTIKAMVKDGPELEFDYLLYSVFDGNEAALRGLVENYMLHLVLRERKGVVYWAVLPMSPLMLHAFGELTKDEQFASNMEKLCAKTKIADLKKKLEEAEKELIGFEEGKASGVGIDSRKVQLNEKIMTLSQKILELEQKHNIS